MVIDYKEGKFSKMSEIYTKQGFSSLNILMGIFPQCETIPVSGMRGQEMSKS